MSKALTPSEDTVNELMSAYLRSEGCDMLGQETASVPGGMKKPDFTLRIDGKYYFGEGEWEKTQMMGMDQARQYGELPQASGSFLILYNEKKLKKVIKARPPGPPNPKKLLGEVKYYCWALPNGIAGSGQSCSLEKLPKWLIENIKPEVKPIQDFEVILSLLESAIATITAEFDEIEGINESNIFNTILGDSTDNKSQIASARNASPYILINQIAFYKTLSYYNKDLFPPLEAKDIKEYGDLQNRFDSVRKIDYETVFTPPLFDSLSAKSLKTLRVVIDAINVLSPRHLIGGTLGTTFHRLIPLEIRKTFAAYYTTNDSAHLLASLAIENPRIKLMDPACGSGTLLIASYSRIKNLIKQKGVFDDEDHRKLIEEQITGIDFMPFAGHLSAVHLALQRPESLTNRVRIAYGDSTGLKPNMSLSKLSKDLARTGLHPTLEDFTSEKNVIESEENLNEGKIKLSEMDLIIMNPPFTRFQYLSKFGNLYKDQLKTDAFFGGYKQFIDSRMSYFNYFILLADKFLGINGKIAAVLPATFLVGETTQGMRDFLLSKYNIDTIIVRTDQPNFSDDTSLREILIIATKKREKGIRGKWCQSYVDYIIIKEFNGHGSLSGKIRKALEKRRKNKINEDYGSFIHRRVPTKKIDSTNLFKPISVFEIDLINLLAEVQR